MFAKVMTLVSLISMGYGELAPSSHHLLPNQAVSSQRYHRGEVPFSNAFSQVHIYSTPKPLMSSNQKLLHGKRYATSGEAKQIGSIQYAPLLKHDEQRYQKGLQPKTHSPHDILYTQAEKQVRKDHLEPKLVLSTKKPRFLPLPHAYKHLEYIPGHNIEVLQSVNREPAHNAVYRSHSNGKHDEFTVKNSVVRENKTSQHTQMQPTTTTPMSMTRAIPTKNNMKYEFILDQYYGPKKSGYSLIDIPIQQKEVPEIRLMETRPAEILQIPGLAGLEKYPYPRLRTLLLNVARTYNLALAPSFKNPLYQPHSQLDSFRRLPAQPLVLNVPGAPDLQPPSRGSKTLLYPVKKNIHFAVN